MQQQEEKKSEKRTWAIAVENGEQKKGGTKILFWKEEIDTSLFVSLGSAGSLKGRSMVETVHGKRDCREIFRETF